MKPGTLVTRRSNPFKAPLWGYAYIDAESGSTVDEIIVLRHGELGVVVAVTSDVAMHWALPRFYFVLGQQSCGWVADKDVVEAK